MLSDLTIEGFLDELAGDQAAPGGGAAAALNGAQGAALVSMVCNLTIGRKRYAEVEADMQEALVQAEMLRMRLTSLIDRDATAFDEVMTAYKLPKDTPEAQTVRSAAIQQGLQTATIVPMETLEACVEVLELCKTVMAKGNPNVVSDGGAGVLTAYAGMMTAAINVRINLNAIKDQAFVDACETRMAELSAQGQAAKDKAWSVASARLGM